MVAGLVAGPLRSACLEEARSVIRLSGAGLVHFLQGIVTNDVVELEAPGAPPQYSCILSAQGRYLHDLLLHRTQDAVPTVLVDVDRQGKADLLCLLKRYRLRQQVDIDDVSQQYRVWAQYGGDLAALHAAHASPPAGCAPDPRLWQLGLRAVLPAGADQGGQGAGAASWLDHRCWRILHGVAEGNSEIPTGEVVPLEFNIDGLRGISFTKGCYVGQELMARTHFKGVVRKRLMPFVLAPVDNSCSAMQQQQLQQQQQAGNSAVLVAAAAAAEAAAVGHGGDQAAAAVQPGAAVFLEHPGGRRKSVGVVRVADGALGLAVLRLSAVQAASSAGQPLVVGEGETAVQLWPWRPDWWPVAWGREKVAGEGAEP